EAADLSQRRVGWGRKKRVERLSDKSRDDLLEDRVPQLLFSPGVVVEVTLSDPPLPQHVVERRAPVTPPLHPPERPRQQCPSRRLAVAWLRTLGRGRLRRHLYQPVGTETYSP